MAGQYIYALAINGETGVERVIENLLHELNVSMMIAGVSLISEINSQLLVKS